MGSLTGAVASERVSEAPKGSLRMDGNLGSRATRHVLSMREILYCEHAQRQTKIVMTTRTVTCSEKLNEIYGRCLLYTSRCV